ncbi:Uncharacterised protein [Mycobacteroides abscessus subsp. massiliense]|uniref:hypothetical protein n=1 Tax=Mycobacteroides abscessus TaxID=36809 RepID=UPI0009A62934|nr:hypothetical protein [Mycobacteroides abscessus]SKH54944.1 Uncharacterised protein [Mycobacteroides abscessus subsp. massiliense]SKH85546.1 Uncharacterised protein [Mycobacteroides abscessus subsp. massiliense]SKK32563.1 Uncharacterised protein [Mycobacteroides abscessus subsp. massiliense]SKK47196.1 Uncharacterised protein [Mycobacteroides abscessus subsp. massiliense]SKL88398.1 Uncharacterised protein [Mycobacteroides abscessus subsp. massiliense]
MNWTIAAAIAGPLLALVGVIAAALIGHHTGTKQVRAAVGQAKAAARQADAAARQARTADWVAYSERIERELGRQDREIVKLNRRLDDEVQRSETHISRFHVAVEYLKTVAEWVSAKWPGERLPDPPAELAEHL